MKWVNHESHVEIYPPKEFKFTECLVFLGRSQEEVLHRIKDHYLYKLLLIQEEMILVKILEAEGIIKVEFPIVAPNNSKRIQVVNYIEEWFDFHSDLEGFYQMANEDQLLKRMAEKYYGLRMVGIPDLFEALTWAIMGQQINLPFAYLLKKRFVESYGNSLTFEGETYWIYPTYKEIAKVRVEDLRNLQFTTRKAEYIIGIAKIMVSGEITKEKLKHLEYHELHNQLMKIRGVGAWTAAYVMMKCFHQHSSFPIADVGLHNALKLQLGLENKPRIHEIKVMATNWEGWQSYATFYLWRSLYD
ncbi:DNA-3-methyladenine glycosylase [Robertmurraya korlensis]|uniref:DNA-3-methyladenine glycosylase family protein n=1 Tax=Robertmurraya korlensis TaxID=519977 RepID=UPI00203C9BA3|nr:DNA-3-methyladenine glycosylase [Robertmurraya korlensis]MCM3601814.1 DNA-3-methyladenine glycosylase [Robertmurraya korlensis]